MIEEFVLNLDIFIGVFAAAFGGALAGTFLGFWFASTAMIAAVKKAFGDDSKTDKVWIGTR